MTANTDMTETSTLPSDSAEKPPRSRRAIAICLGAVLLVVAGVSVVGQGWFSSNGAELTDEEIEAFRAEAERTAAAATPSSPTPASNTSTTVAKPDGPAERDRKIAASMLGDWELFDEGRYQLKLMADHTGKLTYKPDGFKNKSALLLWSGELKIDIRWSVKDGLVEMSSIRGTPKFAFTVATESRGKRKLYRVKDLSDKRLVLFELKNKKTDNWRKLD